MARIAPAEMATKALAGIEHDRVHVLTHSDDVAPIRTRIEKLVAEAPSEG
jgi:hypothetical protein